MVAIPRFLLPVSLALLVAAGPASVPKTRTFTFDYRATIPAVPAGADSVELWLPIPHPDASQDIQQLKISTKAPYTIDNAAYGNKVLHLKVPAAQAAGLTVDMQFQATRREHQNPFLTNAATKKAGATEANDPNMARWLAPDRLVPLDPKIKGWAQEVVTKAKAKTDLEKARAVYEHVVSTVTYDKTGQGWGRGDIYYACDARRGNCTDFHAVFIGYCRALGIPARFSIGFPLPAERGAGEIKGYHCWAEFYTKQTGWVPVDASEAAKDPSRRTYFFGAHDENRVELTRGRDLVLSPQQKGAPLNYFVYPYAEADGKPLEGVSGQFRYQDKTQ
ncbi:transglutaminase-like domain-containing protein [Hymenobacter tibetensis]|uniref:Transglutaminase-like domain-containing protein n=1 Tax=Hymenobacter tibetensis TaxID=497967 RepID=A0ABY4D1Y0_9BACT|nr:transglutaminase-like domain-containing protein [Hymenobacter tibetensis]UOG75131.1 transglutaminase-like domain-containing protein [Hymenobacter tibetensis]